ncbi:exocyst complex component SEC8 [Olea europaea subsp. europaea]|uniref:Exocyst complex component Sec8 n=1 Tax=Olea europaea subsp. europaea TaxID=158383 RepID=A0A8S0T7N5_OLEEU|nr:exocyst complex component SEC8 [Olea europaea subsp. europaea]
MGIFDGLPISRDKSYLREELSKIDESWAAARFDSLPHVVHILTSKDREGDVQILKEQSDIIEEVVDEVVHAYHGGFNKAIQNYSQILRLFSESAQDIGVLKVDLAEAKKLLGARNKQLHQLWYRSVTLRHIISLLDQIEGIAKVPGRIEKLIAEKQFYAAVQLHVQSSLMLEREGLQTVGALQDVRSELTKLRGVLFYKVLEDLHSHLYNKGEYSSVVSSINEIDEAMPTTTAISFSMNNSQTLSRRTRLLKGDNQLGTYGAGDRFYIPSSVDGGSSFDGHDEDGATDVQDDATSDGYTTMQVNGGDTVPRDGKIVSRQIPTWLSDSTPDEFVFCVYGTSSWNKYCVNCIRCSTVFKKCFSSEVKIMEKRIKRREIRSDLIRQGWSRRGPNVLQEGYGTAAVLPEQGIYLAASVYRPVVQFTDKVASMLPEKFCQLGNDGLLTFVENFVKDHFLPTMFVDYRKGVQQAISSPAAFRPRAHAAASYTPLIEKGRPVLQGLLAIDLLAKEVLGWAQAMPKFAGDLINYVQTFLERTYERCRTSYMEAVLEKQSYMLIGRHDVENLMRLDPASACFQNSLDQGIPETNASDEETTEVEMELSDILLNLRPIKQENLIRDDNKLILLASLSDSLEYVAESIERLGKSSMKDRDQLEEKRSQKPMHHSRTSSAPSKDLASFADEYRKLSIDCLKVLRIEMQLETIFHMQEMTNREYLDDQDAEEPDDFVISLTSQVSCI